MIIIQILHATIDDLKVLDDDDGDDYVGEGGGVFCLFFLRNYNIYSKSIKSA